MVERGRLPYPQMNASTWNQLKLVWWYEMQDVGTATEAAHRVVDLRIVVLEVISLNILHMAGVVGTASSSDT
jgi:hypothetical protein